MADKINIFVFSSDVIDENIRRSGTAAEIVVSFKPMKISLIVCTLNREARLAACLESLALLSFPARQWELIVVDNEPRAETESLVLGFSKRVAFSVTYSRESIPGLSRARNRGLCLASGDIFAFTDDDCYPEPDFLKEIDLAFQLRPIDFLAGRIELHCETDAPYTINTSRVEILFDVHAFIPAGPIQGANFAVRRKVVQTIGGFDELLGYGTLFPSEDLEFAARASAAGFRLAYLPGPGVRHHHRRKLSDVPTLLKQYDFGRGAYYARHLFTKKIGGPLANHWIRSMFYNFRIGNWGQPFREVTAALLFSLCRLFHARSVPLLPLELPLDAHSRAETNQRHSRRVV